MAFMRIDSTLLLSREKRLHEENTELKRRLTVLEAANPNPSTDESSNAPRDDNLDLQPAEGDYNPIVPDSDDEATKEGHLTHWSRYHMSTLGCPCEP